MGQSMRNDLFRMLVDGIADTAICLLDHEGLIQTWNAGAARITKYQAEDIVGRPMNVLHDEDERANGHPAWLLTQAVAAGSMSEEGWRIRKDGSHFWGEMVLTALYDETSRLQGFAMVVRDSTIRKLTEDMAAQSENRYRTLIETAGSMIVSLSSDGKIVAWNRASERASGWDKSQALGQRFIDLCVPEESRTPLLTDMQKALHGEPVRKAEHGLVARDGRLFVYSWNFDLLLNSHGQHLGLIAVGQDITERTQAETELRTLNAHLTAMASALEQVREREQRRIARELHDELGHELTALKFEASALTSLAQAHHHEDRSKLVAIGQRLGLQLGRAIDSVRRIARQVRPAVLDDMGLAPALDSLVSDLRTRTELHATFTHEQATEEIHGTEALNLTYYRVAQEALTNVIRHSGATAVAVRLRVEGGELVLEINDNGCGIDDRPDAQEGSFGLRGMKERVEMINGRFSIIGEKGKGTTVAVRAKPEGSVPC